MGRVTGAGHWGMGWQWWVLAVQPATTTRGVLCRMTVVRAALKVGGTQWNVLEAM